MARRAEQSSSPANGDAYVVIREESGWGNPIPLVAGQIATVGRAPSNRVVLQDDICSRHHCEIFLRGGIWTLRDLNSRNGTVINGETVRGDWELEDGQLIQVGGAVIGFTRSLTGRFRQDGDPLVGEEGDTTSAQSAARKRGAPTNAEIVHRLQKSPYAQAEPGALANRDRISRDLGSLYRLAMDMALARDADGLCRTVLDGLFASTPADIGAVLLLRKPTSKPPRPDQLVLAYYRSSTDSPYEKISDFISRMVFERREAVLTRSVKDDSEFAESESLGEFRVESVICAPVRIDDLVFGLIHLYSTDSNHDLNRENLDFTLAVADQLALALNNLTERQSLEQGLERARDENETLKRQLELEAELIGKSRAMRDLRETILRIAPTDATALVRGESGVGKELVARAVHSSSDRKNGPIVCMNCAALSESLLESELFGHEKGSFTGAVGRKTGKFEQANKGTLFFDEVGEMGAAIQAKFLRVLEGHPFERVGGSEPISVDVRVVAATNRDLEEAVADGTFRKDLYFRLHVVEILVVPLRERGGDVALLADYFLKRCAEKSNKAVRGFTREAIDALQDYNWPGNVRELQNTVERAVILCRGEEVTPDEIQLSTLGKARRPDAAAPETNGYREVPLEQLEREHILATLEFTEWNKSQAAQILGIERSTLDRKLKRYKVSRPAKR